MKRGEIVLSAVCVGFFGFMLSQTFELLGQGRAGEVGSGLWPLMALLVSIALSLLMLVSSIKKSMAAAGQGEQVVSPEAAAERKRARFTVALSVVCFLAYMILMPLTGFVLTTFLYILAFALVLGERRRWVLAVSPVLLTAVILGVFAKFITIPFPKGVGIFADFSRLFY